MTLFPLRRQNDRGRPRPVEAHTAPGSPGMDSRPERPVTSSADHRTPARCPATPLTNVQRHAGGAGSHRPRLPLPDAGSRAPAEGCGQCVDAASLTPSTKPTVAELLDRIADEIQARIA